MFQVLGFGLPAYSNAAPIPTVVLLSTKPSKKVVLEATFKAFLSWKNFNSTNKCSGGKVMKQIEFLKQPM